MAQTCTSFHKEGLTLTLAPPLSSGIMQQFAISEATLFGWNSMDGESLGAGSNQGSMAHLSEVNQESITSRGTSPLT